MPVANDSDLKEILARFDKIEDKIENMQKDIIHLKISQSKLEEKINGVEKRLENQDFINRNLIAEIILALIPILIIFYF